MATYYVADSDGNNGYDGLAAAYISGTNGPWKTIQYAVSQAQAGDTVYIRTGTYNEAIEMARSGSEGSPITFVNYTGESPVIDGNGTGEVKLIDWGVGEEADLDYIVLSGLTIINALSWAIWIEGNHNIVTGCVVYDAGSTGVLQEHGDYNEFLCNHIYSVGYNGLNCEDGNYATIKGNVVHDTGHQCINVFSDTAEYYGLMVGNNITHNICYNADETGIYTRHQQDNIIANNLVYDNPLWGILLASGGTGAPSEYEGRTKIYNNTVVDNGYDGIFVQYATGCFVRNNIITGNNWTGVAKAQLRFGLLTDQTADYDMFTSSGDVIYWTTERTLAEFQGLGQEANGFIGTAGFVNATGSDYSLDSESDAIDNGATLAEVTDDIVGTTRPKGSACDAGAYEYTTAINKFVMVFH